METINCPVCGEENPAEEEKCQECGQPLRQSTSELEGGGKLLDAGENPTKQETSELESSLPAWLKNARQSKEEQDASSPKEEKREEKTPLPSEEEPEEDEPEEDSLDWLAGLDADDEDEDDETAEWLANLQSGLGAEGDAQEEPPPETPALEEQITAGEAPHPSDLEEPPIQTGELPDWISDLQADAEATQKDDSLPLPDLPDEDKSEFVEKKAGADAIKTGDLPDWLSDLSKEETDETPAVQPASDVEEDAGSPERDAAEDAPDWMADLEPSADAEAESPAPSMEGDDDLPDWMSALEPPGEAEEEKEEESPAPSVEEGEDFPDWLSALPAEDFSGAGEEAESADFGVDIDKAEASEKARDAASPPAEEEFPDWLSKMEKPAAGALDEAKPEEAQDEKEAVSSEEAGEERPNWLDSLTAVEGEQAEEELSSSPVFVEADDDFDDLGDDEEEIFGIEMPDWLSRIGSEDIEEEGEAQGEARVSGEEADLSDADLPDWVQAMRPVESVVADSSKSAADEFVASSGPLAGLSGVLPASPGLGEISKPRAYSIKLQVSESQQKSAAVLEELLAEEDASGFTGTSKRKFSVPLVRWFIAVLLFFVVGFSIYSQSQIAPPPQFALPEIGDAIEVINQLPAEGRALLVFDYEVGFSGEMEAVSLPVVEHLMLRGQKMAFLSTTPMGPALAEDFFAKTQSAEQYSRGEDFVNLGYLPGNASGMASFLNDPRGAVSVSAEEGTMMSAVDRIDDFSVIVILTDDVEKGRFWIEQSASVVEKTPLLMVVSAQAEPIMYPYYASGQVAGLVSGLSGGATYETMQGLDGLSRKYWDSYSLGLLVAEILIPIGALINFLAVLRARRKNGKEGK